MSIRDALQPPKEFLQELARDDHPKGGGRRDSRVGTAPPPRPPASSGTPAATAILAKSVAALVNTPVTMHLRNGTQLSGILLQVWQYEFVLATADGGFIVILKHAVDMLEPASKE